MGTRESATEFVVRSHLQAFLDQKGVDPILVDYDDDARFLTESRTYHGKREIREFFEAFIASLPPDGINRFSLRCLRVEGEVGYITWRVGSDELLGTDTFLVRNGKIVSQTVAIHVPATA
jgi:ketosteroid isomerase-like protein